MRKSRNLIHSLQHNGGSWISTQQDMLTLVVNVLQKGYSEHMNKVDTNDIMDLLHKLNLPSLTDQ